MREVTSGNLNLKLMVVALSILCLKETQNVYVVLINVHVNCGAALRCVSEFRSLSLAKQRSAAAT
jgi:hypothetical protein